MRRTSAIRATASSLAVAFGLCLAGPAFAQVEDDDGPDSALEADEPSELEQTEVELESGQDTADASGPTSEGAIVVTGSRLRRPNIDSTLPITSVGAQDLVGDGDLSLGDSLNQLPSLRSTFSQANSTRFIGTAGLNLLDLRGLGSARTLVLVNGRRHVSSAPGSFAVDVNTIPLDLLERVDVITGGNSAIYGSDAVSGVVNFVLRRDYEGIKVRGQVGISDEGDRHTHFIAGIFGRNFWDDRANIAIAAEYSKSDALFFADRPDQFGTYAGVPGFVSNENPFIDDPNVPDQVFLQGPPGITFNIISLGGTVLTSCPGVSSTNPILQRRINLVCTGTRGPAPAGALGGLLSDNYMFMPDGTLLRNNPAQDLRPIGGPTLGGLGATGVEDAMALPGLERYSANLLFNVEIAPAFRPFLEAKFVHINATQQSTQPTFVNSRLSPFFFIDNPFLTDQARQLITDINRGTFNFENFGAFTFFRFNNDIGTRSEDHERQVYRIVAGARGDLSAVGNWNYEVAFNYGRFESEMVSGGNVHVARFNAAADAVRDPATGQIVCRINVDANPNNDDPACRPINLFGYGAPLTTPEGLNYVLSPVFRDEWAEQINAIAFISGDTGGFFNLPGGPVGVAAGVEYRKEDAFSDYDDVTQTGATFHNNISIFDPPSIDLWEAFGELRIPILADMPFFHELTLEGAARYSDYSSTGGVWAYNVGAIWAPVRDIRFRGGYARSVRAPDLSDLFATASETFANNLVDPCSQTVINQNPNRARNCAEAGIPTTITLPDGTVVPWVNNPSSGISGINSGNPALQPEVGKSITVGAVIQPRWVPGLSLTIDYYNIEITEAIAGLTGQAIINRCYDDPVGIDNPFCAAVFRRRTPGDPIADFTFEGQAGRRFAGFPDFPLPVLGPGFINQPFNFQKLKTQGIDFDLAYRREIAGVDVNVRAILSRLLEREFFTFITAPEQSVRVHGVLGDPEWAGSFRVGADFGEIDVDYHLRYTGKQLLFNWETIFPHQGRDPAQPDTVEDPWTPHTFYHDLRLGFEPDERFRFYVGVDNVFDTLPPFGLTGTGGGSGDFPLTGRYYYAGVEVKFD